MKYEHPGLAEEDIKTGNLQSEIKLGQKISELFFYTQR